MTQFMVDVALDADGLVSVTPVGFPAEPWLGLQALPVTGGVLQVDARRPEAGVRAFIAAPEVADWLVPLFGADITREAVRLSHLLDPVEHSTSFPVDTGPFYDRTARLVYGLWLRRWWPSPVGTIPAIDEWLLDIELGDLAVSNEQLFGGSDPAVELLEPHTPLLAAALDSYVRNEGANETADAIGAVLLSAAASTLSNVDSSSAGYDELDDALRRHETIEKQMESSLAGGIALDLALAELGRDLTALSPLRELSEARELSVATTAPPLRRHLSTLDWVQVHPRSADATALSVVSTVHRESSGLTLAITVPASRHRADDRLYARVQLADGGTLAAVLVAEDGGYSAVVALPHDCDYAGLSVSIYSAEFGSGARRGSPDEVVRAVRRLVLDTVGARVADLRRMATGDLRDGDLAALAAEKRAIRPS